ncbi:MAG: hypothetical protein M1817_003668 [Caeruleum heppii]|nr:MAG: hypothetical protein M1817_003668 [Caeruleum heppii]
MHTSIIASALFAALALATPIKRDVVTAVDVVVNTVIVTVTAGDIPTPTPTPEPVVVTTTILPQRNQFFAPQEQEEQPASAPASSSVQAPAPAPSEEAPAPAPAPAQAQEESVTSGGTDFKSQSIFHHNVHRANHSAPALEWSDALASTAQKIANTCQYKHNTAMDGGGYGQNIAAGNGPEKIGNVISDQFYNAEMEIYSNLGFYGKEPNTGDESSRFHDWGHFSQMVWKSAAKFGCAVQKCGVLRDAGGNDMAAMNIPPFFTVCNYDQGNMGGQFGQNVLPPQQKSVVLGSDTS